MIYRIPFTLVIEGEYQTTDEPKNLEEAIQEARDQIPPLDNEGVDSNYGMTIHGGRAYEWDEAAKKAHTEYIQKILKGE